VDPLQPISEIATAREKFADSIDLPRFLLVLMCILASVALGLAAIGIYGVLAYGVAQRQQEMGVRLALGARPVNLSAMVVGDGFRLAVIGTAIGVSAALGLGRFLRAVLYGVEPSDPFTVAAVVTTALAVAVAACALPAVRASRCDPATVLRAE
jgi:ABC-type antimicrobial peptide transport system permease subunit